MSCSNIPHNSYVTTSRLINQAILAKENASVFLEMNDIFDPHSDKKQFSYWLDLL
jgi:hypothetical protein